MTAHRVCLPPLYARVPPQRWICHQIYHSPLWVWGCPVCCERGSAPGCPLPAPAQIGPCRCCNPGKCAAGRFPTGPWVGQQRGCPRCSLRCCCRCSAEPALFLGTRVGQDGLRDDVTCCSAQCTRGDMLLIHDGSDLSPPCTSEGDPLGSPCCCKHSQFCSGLFHPPMLTAAFHGLMALAHIQLLPCTSPSTEPKPQWPHLTCPGVTTAAARGPAGGSHEVLVPLLLLPPRPPKEVQTPLPAVPRHVLAWHQHLLCPFIPLQLRVVLLAGPALSICRLREEDADGVFLVPRPLSGQAGGAEEDLQHREWQ